LREEKNGGGIRGGGGSGEFNSASKKKVGVEKKGNRLEFRNEDKN